MKRLAMETELIELFEAVKKAADAAAVEGVDLSPEEDRCLDALKTLKKFPVNYQILVSTQVGKRLRQLTKHPRKKIQSLASDLVEIWKTIIVEETLKSKKNGNLGVKESPKSDHRSATVEKKKVRRANSVKVEKMEELQVGSEKKEPATNDVSPSKLNSLIYCQDPVRDKIRELLADALCKVRGEVDDDGDESKDKVTACDPYRVAVSVETAMFEKWGKSNGAQKVKYRSIMFNVKDPKNPDFRRKILVGELKPERVVELTPEEMASNERQMQNVKIKEKALFECERVGPPKATTDQFKCGRCGRSVGSSTSEAAAFLTSVLAIDDNFRSG
ncbi:hypothetical protein E3N88_23452 [Mikania micrantha]|uniref:TFIIS N-terminal domain-containing protein n=1 Tax=Mikania micrantha TaxID=192012 RepID=A0A5N6NDB6_9ASTR|nr:hypothetical protein E3N88_23452 [Mikania micrantha]